MRHKIQVLSILVLGMMIGMAGVAGAQTALPKPGVTGNINVAEEGNWTNGLPSVDKVGTITLSAEVDAYYPAWGTWRDNKSIIIESSDGFGKLKFTKADGVTIGQYETQFRNEIDVVLNGGTWEPYGDRAGIRLTGETTKVTVNGGLLDCADEEIEFRNDGATFIQNGGVVRCQKLDSTGTYPNILYAFNGGNLEIGSGGIANNNVRIDFGANNDGALLINTGSDYRETLLTHVAEGVFSVAGETVSNFGRFYKVEFDAATGITTLQLNGPENPAEAKNASPENGATNTLLEVTLSWTPGQGAVQHDVYFGNNYDDVNDADPSAVKGRQDATTYGPLTLELSKTYYWRVDEVTADGTVTKGQVWFFSPPKALVVDDIESYNDLDTTDPESNRIFETWIDGYGKDENGSTVGYPDPNWVADEHFVETKIVHGGEQSMPFFYDNSGLAKYSEAVANIADLKSGSDWTVGGAKVLDLWYNGDASNAAEPMYVALSDGTNTAVVVNSDPNAVLNDGWAVWRIILQDFVAANNNLNLANISQIAIGFGDRDSATPGGGSGLVLFDDIAVYGTRCLDEFRPTLAEGNLNGDCIIDQKDIDILMENWLKSGLWP